MLKIKRIRFKDHPILKNLELDFSGKDGLAVDTVIIAGENGSGKSAVLNYIYSLASGRVQTESEVLIETAGSEIKLDYRFDEGKERIWVSDNRGLHTLPGHDSFKKKYAMNGIFSDVEINFGSDNVTAVTSMSLDASVDSRRSTNDLPRQIKQLLIDVQALDDATLSRAVRENPKKSKEELRIDERMRAVRPPFELHSQRRKTV